jgi:Cysteine sulfinate desulfinase/cysteine desulfurase and related enzymes
MEIYLDHAATTVCSEEVKNIVVRTMMEDYGNPSSKHKKGMQAETYLKSASEAIAKILKVNAKEIFYTSGGTEANNWALIGSALANKRIGKHIITTTIEHKAVLETLKFLEEDGYEITYLKPDSYGVIQVSQLAEAIREDTILVSVMFVNNEIGAVQLIEEMGKAIKSKNPKTLFHVDAIQAFGKYKIFPKRQAIDLLSVSAHKIHGPKGSGFLYIQEQVKIRPMIWGGGQQRGMRSGTDNVSGAAGLGVAAVEMYTDFERKIENLYELRAYFLEGLKSIEDIKINGYTDRRNAPHILSVSFGGIRSEVLLHALEEKEIYVSSGSACSSNKGQKAGSTLEEIKVSGEYIEGTIRFSFSRNTTKEEIDCCLQELTTLVPTLRKYMRR